MCVHVFFFLTPLLKCKIEYPYFIPSEFNYANPICVILIRHLLNNGEESFSIPIL